MSHVVIGSNKERGLTKAVQDVFHEATQPLCVQHLKDNASDYMRNKCGIQQSVHTLLVDTLLSDHGLLGAKFPMTP